MNLSENNYGVIESWGVVMADKIWGRGDNLFQFSQIPTPPNICPLELVNVNSRTKL